MKIKVLACSMALALVGTMAQAADYTVKPTVTSLKTTPKSILLVGNSFMYYNCGVNGYLSGIAKAKGGLPFYHHGNYWWRRFGLAPG